jgi:hypothetical protein
MTMPRPVSPTWAASALALLFLAAGTGPAAARADLGAEPASATVRHFADWVIASDDDHGLTFAIVDKVQAKVFVFYPDGRLRGAAPALLGQARGDDSTPGIGERPLSRIRAGERTTPAGRFAANLGNDLGEKDVLWVDYADAIALHRVITTNPKEHRLQRLATATPLDNRISYGCINVPADFYDGIVQPAFAGAGGIVYILPEVRALRSVFPGYDDDRTLAANARQ